MYPNTMKGGFTVKDKMFRRIISFVIALAMIVPTLAVVYADEVDTGATQEQTTEIKETSAQGLDDANRARTYSTYYDKHVDAKRPDTEVVIPYSVYTNASEETGAYVDTIEGVEALVWPNASGSVDFPVTVTEEGVYNIEFVYYALASAANDIEFSVLIDGEAPYATAERVLLSKVWVDNEKGYMRDENGDFVYAEDGSREFKMDSHGNQIRPTLVEFLTWQTASLKDTDGLFNDPLRFFFTKGDHVITLKSEKARFAISQIRLYNEKPVAATADAENVTTDASVAGASKDIYVKLEGEKADFKSDVTLYATYNRSTYLTSPSDAVNMIYNTIGADNWKAAGQTVTWNFTMEEAGWVKIGIRAKQDLMRGLYSNRRLYIDGKVPCADAEQVKFYYSTTWECVTPTDENGNALYFWLEAGDHTLALEAVPGEIGDIMRQLDDVVYYLNSYYRQILQITGPLPDEYNTYMIQNQIPSIIPDFQKYSDMLIDLKGQIEVLAGTEGTEAVSLETMSDLLKRCIKRPDDIPSNLGQIKDNITSLAQWMTDYRSQYLEVDMIEIVSADKDFATVKENFLQSLWFSTKSFIGSFFADYNILSDTSKDSLNVWVSLGRDQAQIVKELVDSYFVPETGIEASINLVQGGILEATLAGKGPDVALFIGGDFPIQLAARDCLVDISQFEDYDEVTKRFADNIMTLYTYSEGPNKGVYGLPISQGFSMMFTRTDVLESFGFDKGPQTWDELIEMLPTLQRSYMGVGFGFDVFGTFMVQRNMTYYNDTLTETRFEEQDAVEAFEMWTKFYTTYSFQQSFDQFTRFRTGEYPIIITGYTFYNQLYMAAPEIRGLWELDLIPGTPDENGNLNRSTTSGSAGCIIFSKLNEQQRKDAWELCKWFTSGEIQAEYGRSIEALLGPLGRFDTANQEALAQLAWSQSELDLILTQMNNTVEIDIIPSTYIVGRNITNAFRDTVNLNKNPRDTLAWYNRDINDEIMRKYEELGLTKEDLGIA